MKFKYISLLAALAVTISATAAEQFRAKNDNDGLWYEWEKYGESVRTASGTGFSVGMGLVWGNDPNDNWAWKEMPALVLTNTDPNVKKGPNASLKLEIPSYITVDVDGVETRVPVVAIGDYSFAALEDYSNDLGTIRIPATVERIGKGAFFKGSNLQGIEFAADGKLGIIGDYAFGMGRGNNINLNIPSSVYSLGIGAFYKLQNVERIDVQMNGIIGREAFKGVLHARNVVIGDNVTEIGEDAFVDCSEMESLVIGDNIKDIPAGAFAHSNLKNVTFGKNLETIGASAFEGCSNLDKIDFSACEKLTTICEAAFKGCNLGSYQENDPLVFPASLRYIEASAFENCKSLNGIRFQEGLKSIGAHAFDHCSAIKGTVRIPDSLTEIGEYAFNMCGSIHEIILGANVRKVGDYAFFRVDHVTANRVNRWYIPATAMEIGENAFNFQNTNSTFTDIYYPNLYPDHIHNNAFGLVGDEGVGLDYCPDYWMYLTVCLHVPVGTRDTYKKLDGWKNFHCIIDDIVLDGDPLDNVLGYAYMIPGEVRNINTDILKHLDTENLKWQVVTEDEGKAVSIDENADVTGLKFGEYIAIATRTGNFVVDDNGNVEDKPDNFSGAVIIFVCPTVTVVYDVDNTTSAPGSNGPVRAPGLGTNGTMSDSDVVAYAIEHNVTYEHRVVFNSYPQFVFEGARGINIETIQRAKTDAEGEVVEEGELRDLEEGQRLDSDDNISPDGDHVIPLNPVQENRIITLPLSISGNYQTTGVQTVEVSSTIKVTVDRHTLTIQGAQDDAVVTVTDMNGRTVMSTTDKTNTLHENGVYIVTVEDVAFKAMVH